MSVINVIVHVILTISHVINLVSYVILFFCKNDCREYMWQNHFANIVYGTTDPTAQILKLQKTTDLTAQNVKGMQLSQTSKPTNVYEIDLQTSCYFIDVKNNI